MLVEKQQIADDITHLTNKRKDELQAAVKQVESWLTHQIQSLEEQLDDVTVQLEDKTSELLFLQEQWNGTEGKLLEANKHVKAKEQEIHAMNEKAAARKNGMLVKYNTAGTTSRTGGHVNGIGTNHKATTTNNYTVLESSTRGVPNNMEERVEVATAPVQAAKQLALQVSEQLQDSDRRHQRTQALLKLYQLVLKGLLREAADQSGQE